uniref:Uncharacterized protein n=1 Tax=Leersia perrieri TaxID=77586 RepID=A0A0D9UY32_9ORYZ
MVCRRFVPGAAALALPPRVPPPFCLAPTTPSPDLEAPAAPPPAPVPLPLAFIRQSAGHGIFVASAMSSFRRLVHLVTSDCSIRNTYSLRSIDMSALFAAAAAGNRGGESHHHPPAEPSPLPPPDISFYPPFQNCHGQGSMEFMLLGGNHNKVVAADQTGRTVLYDPDQHAIRTMRSLNEPKTTRPVSVTIGDDLYVLETILPEPPDQDGCFECFEWDTAVGSDRDWHPRVLPTPPYEHEPEADDVKYPVLGIKSYTVVDGTKIWISKADTGTYAYDTAAGAWSKAGEWTLPFTGHAHYVPEHGLWFGLSGTRAHGCVLRAADLAAASPRRPPATRNLWRDLVPPAEWRVALVPHLVHLGAGKFCIARFFDTDPFYGQYTYAVFTGVEVVRCADADGGLRMVKYGSKLYMLLSSMGYKHEGSGSSLGRIKKVLRMG